jgi:hypothetical protein
MLSGREQVAHVYAEPLAFTIQRTRLGFAELPPLRWPRLSNVLLKTLARLEWYVKEALPLLGAGSGCECAEGGPAWPTARVWFLPGCVLRVTQRTPVIVVQIEQTELAIETEVARAVQVEELT